MSNKPKKILWTVLRLLIAGGLVAYVLSQSRLSDTVRPGPDADPCPIVRETADAVVIRAADGAEQRIGREAFGPDGAVRVDGILSIAQRLSAHWAWAVAALGAMMLQSPLGAIRWRLLLRVQGIRISFWESLRLTYIGWFFNNWLPGATGGDFVKAYYIAALTHHKPEAVTVVFLDRFLGLIAICLIGAVAVAASLDDARVRVAQIVVGSFMVATLVGGFIFYSRRLRAALRLDRLLAKLPMARTVAKIDRALFAYRYHKRTVALAILYSWGTQVGSVLAMWWIANGLGSHAQWYHYFLNMPVVWIGWALVPVPGGFGVAESLMQHLFGPAILGGAAPLHGAEAASLALAMMLAFRLVQMAVSLPGAVFYLGRRTNVSPAHMREQLEEPNDEAPPPTTGDETPDP